MGNVLNAEVAFPQFPALDQYGPNTTLLLHGDGANSAQNNTFLDSSSNNFTITRNGNTTQGTFSPFSQPNGYWSNLFNGTSDGLQTTALNISSGNFTIEAFVYLNAMPTTDSWPASFANWMNIVAVGTASLADGWQFRIGQTVLAFGTNNDTTAVSGTHAMVVRNWYHLAVVRNGNVYTLFVNGTSIASATYTANSPGTGAFTWVGNETNQGAYLNGYISNLRLVAGTALYTANFTPSTIPLTAVSGTGLLTCQSNRFVDNSSSALPITITSSPSIQAFKPFSAPTNYYPAVNGGSGYFDGSGDYLSLANNTAFDEGSSWCAECWVYPNYSSGADKVIMGNFGYGSPYNGWDFIAQSASGVIFRWGYPSYADSGAAFTIQTYAWNHIAASISGGRLSVYANGVRVFTTTSNITATAATGPTLIGYNNIPNSVYNGYISNARIVKGSTPYDPTQTTITVPTAPLTAITNTQLLTSFTNAGIIDSVSQNVLETVGNAQVSTTQSKFGGASMYFDGTGDWLTIAQSNVNLQFNTGDFTIEFWWYPSSLSTAQIIYFHGNDVNVSGAGEFIIVYNTSLGLRFYINGGSPSIDQGSTSGWSTGIWYHVAAVRSGNTLTLYRNGLPIASGSVSGITIGANVPTYIGGEPYDPLSLNGYIDDLRITKGVARYTQNFTPPQNAFPNYGPLTNIPTVDPNFNSNTLLLHGNGAVNTNNNTFIDSSANGFSITRNGNTTQGTFTPFSQPNGWWSNYFNGTSDYLSFTSNSTTIGTGDFTIEAWINPGSQPTAYSTIIGGSVSGTPLFNINGTGTASTISLNAYGSGNAISATISFAIGVWCHIAVSRSGTSLKLFVNGSQVASVTDSTNFSQPIKIIGSAGASNQNYAGYVSNARVVVGTAVYTSNFTPSILPLTAITNTNVLTCQSNYFKDNSTNNFTITPSGTPSIQNRYPFFPPLDYSTDAIGGSGYFDGSGDYLTAASNAAFAIGTGEYSIECWVYFTGTPEGGGVSGEFFGSTTTGAMVLRYKSGTLALSRAGTADDMSASVTITANQWYHICATRTGTTGGLYLNGTRVASASSYTASYAQGDFGTINNTLGYLSNCRLVKGANPYGTGTTITVPTAPLTPITGTSLLLSCTNYGIFDNASKNDLETVSTAKIVTSNSKYGGSSMSFNGSSDYLKLPYTAAAFGTGDFTIEAWVYITQEATQNNIIDTRSTAGGSNPFLWTIAASTQVRKLYYFNGTAYYSSNSVPLNTWTHIAISRAAGTVRQFINGVQGYSATDTSNFTGTSTSTVNIGTNYNATGGWFTGNMNDLRITIGVSRYNYNFTPPLALLPNK